MHALSSSVSSSSIIIIIIYLDSKTIFGVWWGRKRKRREGGRGGLNGLGEEEREAPWPLSLMHFGCLLCGLKHPKMYNIDDL
jgi:hypothetical protein